MNHMHQKLRLQEFNRYDIERILRENLTALNLTNEEILKLVEEYGSSLGPINLAYYVEELTNNAAQTVHISSILLHSEDLAKTLMDGPLIRKEGKS